MYLNSIVIGDHSVFKKREQKRAWPTPSQSFLPPYPTSRAGKWGVFHGYTTFRESCDGLVW